MDFVWVFPLILAFISIGQIHTVRTVQSPEICKKCDAGHYKTGDCSNGKYNCKKCEKNTFTAIENTLEECIRCTPCRSNEVEIQSCSFDHDTKCDCKDHHYYYGTGHSKYCMPCPDPSDSSVCGSADRRQLCRLHPKSCEENPDCKRKCIAAITNTTSSPTISTDNGKMSSTSNPAQDPVMAPVPKNHMLWLFYVVVLLVVVVFFGLVLLLTWIHSEKPNMCPRWATNNCVEPHAEDSKFSEHCSHQDSSPTTLTINISEETPMMPLNYSPITPEHPAHIAPLLPNSAQKGAKQDEQSEQWPAIVLYAIIKEVPLRRWKEFLRLLSVADQQLDRVELEAGLGQGSIERQYQMLRLWSQRPTASLNDVFSALHYMDLSGCAQLLQDSLEKLQWRPATMQDT